MSLRSFAIAALLAAPGASAASTLDVFLQGSAVAGQEFGMFDEFTYAPDPIETLANARSEAAQATGSFGDAEAKAEYEFDGAAGLLRANQEARVSDPPPESNGKGSASVQSLIDLRENFIVSGSGNVKIGMSIDVTWNAIEWFFNPQVSFFESSGLTGVTSLQSSILLIQITDGNSGSLFDEVLELSFDIDAPSGGMIEFRWLLSSVVAAGSINETGDSTLAYTANIFVLTDGNVTATPQTAGFLAGPGSGGTDPGTDPEVNVIPLPASAVLLLAGLGGLGALRRRRHSAD